MSLLRYGLTQSRSALPDHFDLHQGGSIGQRTDWMLMYLRQPGRRRVFPAGVMMFKRILLPTDGSETARRAVVAAISLAKELGAEVVGLTVIPRFHVFTYQSEMLEDTREEYAIDSQKRASEYLQYIADTARAEGVNCSVEYAVSDEPDEVITSIALERGCDLIAIGSHGRRGIKGLLLGSVTQKVLVHSSVPVLVYR
jgi:nucleotide-binding universal stress UspA family protein